MYEIRKQFEFSASHQLNDLPAEHQCARLHGHNYIVEVVLGGTELDRTGFIVDYGKLHFVKEYIDAFLDHRHLNDVLDCNPTAENMARILYTKFKPQYEHLIAVRVSETPKTWAQYTA